MGAGGEGTTGAGGEGTTGAGCCARGTQWGRWEQGNGPGALDVGSVPPRTIVAPGLEGSEGIGRKK
jgi:hypothetical protein